MPVQSRNKDTTRPAFTFLKSAMCEIRRPWKDVNEVVLVSL